MGALTQSISAYLAALLLALTLVIGPWVLVSMSMVEGHMSCPFMQGQMSMCSMTVIDHINHWQSAFALTLTELLTVVAVVATLVLWQLLPRKEEASPPSARESQRPTIFQELFSQGILNSKAY